MNPSETLSSNDTTAPEQSGLRATTAKAKEATARAANQVREKATEAAAARKGMAADKISGYSSALRDSARQAGEQHDDNIAYFANTAADKLEEAADYFRNADLGQIQRDAAQLARRHPALMLGGMLVAGLVLGNLAKASVQSLGEDDEEDFSEPYDDGNDAPADYSSDSSHDEFEAGDNREANPPGMGEPQI